MEIDHKLFSFSSKKEKKIRFEICDESIVRKTIYGVQLIENVNKFQKLWYETEWKACENMYSVKNLHLFRQFVEPLSQSICWLLAKQYLLKNILKRFLIRRKHRYSYVNNIFAYVSRQTHTYKIILRIPKKNITEAFLFIDGLRIYWNPPIVESNGSTEKRYDSLGINMQIKRK